MKKDSVKKEVAETEQTKLIKVGVKNMSAFSNIKAGETINVWGNTFTVGSKGELEAELPEDIVIQGVEAGRYVIIEGK
jgi:hypothetical protein